MDWFSLIPVGATLLLAGFNAAFCIIIKFNDFSHLQKALEEIKVKINDMDKKLDKTSERLSFLYGKVNNE